VIAGGQRAFGTLRPPIDPHRLAREIIAEPRFRVAVIRPKPKTWWDVFVQWLGDRWHQLLDAFSRHVHVAPNVSVAFGDVLIVLAVLVVIAFGIRLAVGISREQRNGGVHSGALPRNADAQTLYLQSTRAANRGDYTEAASLLFRAALALSGSNCVIARSANARVWKRCFAPHVLVAASPARALHAKPPGLLPALPDAGRVNQSLSVRDEMR
jgi:hypothetical protein